MGTLMNMDVQLFKSFIEGCEKFKEYKFLISTGGNQQTFDALM